MAAKLEMIGATQKGEFNIKTMSEEIVAKCDIETQVRHHEKQDLLGPKNSCFDQRVLNGPPTQPVYDSRLFSSGQLHTNRLMHGYYKNVGYRRHFSFGAPQAPSEKLV